MHLTFLTGEYPPMQGGIADYTAILARNLQQLAVTPAILIDQTYGQARLAEQVPVHPAVCNWGFQSWADIKQFLSRYPTDVLHIQYQAAAFDLKGWINWLPWGLRRWSGCPKIVTTFHDLRIPYLFPKAGLLRWQAILTLARYSHAVICTNSEDRARLEQYPWADHISQIPLGNNVPLNPPADYDRQAWRKKLGFAEQTVGLAYFGFLNESKGGEELMAVLASLVARGIDARLLMIGGDVGDSDPTNRHYARRVRQLMAEQNLTERVIFTGYVDLPQVSAHLLAADLAVMPYRDGVSFRRTTLLAVLQHGLPVISTRPAVALPQLVEGENMLLVPPGDVAGLTEQIIRVVDDRRLKNQLGQGAGQLAADFDWDQIASQTATLYSGL